MAILDHNRALLTDFQSAFQPQDRALSRACSVCFHTMALAVAAVAAVQLREVPQAPTPVYRMEFLLTDPQSEADQTASSDPLSSADPVTSQETAALTEDSSPVEPSPSASSSSMSAEVVQQQTLAESSMVQQMKPHAPPTSDPVPIDSPMPIERQIETVESVNESYRSTAVPPTGEEATPATETTAKDFHDHAELSSHVPPERSQNPVEAIASITPALPHSEDSASLPQTDPASAIDSNTGSSGSFTASPTDTVALSHPTIARTVPTKQHLAWLMELLRRQILSLQAYPHMARMQGWEGIVIVRTTIKSDGTLVEAVVTKSSGYDALDEDALKLMQRVYPIRLPQDLGQSQIAVLIPIRYRLNAFN